MKPHIGVAGLALMAATLVACGGGGGSSPFIGPALPSTTSASASLSTSSTTPVQLSQISNGSSAAITLPATSVKANAKVSLQGSLPSGASQPQAKTLAASSRIASTIGATVTALDYILVSLDTTVSITSTPAFSFTLASPIASSSAAYIAVLDLNAASAGWNVVLGPGTISGPTVTFAAQALAPPLTLNANDTYVFALVVANSTITPPPPTIAPNSASYTGTKSVNYTYGFGYSYPNPVPTATAPPTTLSYTVSANVSVGSSPFPGKTTAQVVDEHVSESDASNLSSTTFTTDSWVSVASASGAFNELLYGQTQQEPTSANLPMMTTIYGTPQIVDEFPESSSNAWQNSPAAGIAYSYADGDSGTRTVNADGTYLDTEQMGPTQGGATVTMTENKDGSGSIAGPIEGGFITSINVSAPSPVPSSTPVITVTEAIGTSYQQPPYNYPPVLTKHDGLWYTPTSQYYTENDTVKTGATLPSGCTPSAYGVANEVVRKISNLDTVIGDLETTEFDSYNVDGFPVCMVTTDVLSFAYGQQGTTPSIFAVGPLGLEVVTTNETLVIQTAPAANSRHTQSAVRTNSFIGALQAHQLNAFQRERVIRVRSFIKHINGGQQ